MHEILEAYKREQEEELRNILEYWKTHAVDNVYGGFYGKISNDNLVDPFAPKGSVLNGRILWTFSAAYNRTKNEDYIKLAHRAYQYILDHFIDKTHGGVYWSVTHKGEPLDTKKQIYALAFVVYGLTEYVRAANSEEAKEKALQLYEAIERHSHDRKRGGYIEALTAEWKEITDLRLSEKDANERKSMNTHLHVLEAYTNLYRIWPDETLKKNIIELVDLFLNHIIDKKSNHLHLFFGDEWNVRSDIFSYGHDIEAAWLLQEAAGVTGEKKLLEKVKKRSVKIAEAAAEGLDQDGGLWYEYERSKNHLVKEKHWWPQAEAMVGFLNAWQISKEEKYLQYSLQCWRFIQEHILNKDKGEWYWGVNEDYSKMPGEDKVGFWKCPYHNSRACLEVAHRIEASSASSTF